MKKITLFLLLVLLLSLFLCLPCSASWNTGTAPPENGFYVPAWTVPANLNSKTQGVCIVGHSHVTGLSLCTVSDTDYICKDGMTAVEAAYSQDFLLPDGDYGSIAWGLSQKSYKTVVLMLGTNDMPYGKSMLPDFKSNMENLLDLLQSCQPDAALCLVSLAPVGRTFCSYTYGFDKNIIQEYNHTLMEIAEKRQIPFIDIFTPLADEEGFTALNYESTDGLHFTMHGYRVMLTEIMTSLP